MNERSTSKLLWPTVAFVVAVFGILFIVLRQYSKVEAKFGPAGWTGINAPYIQSTDSSVKKMIELAEVTEKDVVYDLGCGDGRLVIGAVKLSGCRGVGIDLEAARIEESIENAKRQGVAEKIEFRQQDIFQADLSECTVSLIYLTKWMVEKLKTQFDTMKPGSRIVSQDFWIEQVHPQKIEQVEVESAEGNTSIYTIYVYETPLQHDQAMERGTPPRESDIREPLKLNDSGTPS